MGYLALDQSKNRAGWAFWKQGLDLPVHGHFRLGDEYSPAGKVFARLHMELSDLHKALGFESVRYEQPADPQTFGQPKAFADTFLLIGIAAHINSFCAALGIRPCEWVHMATWRRHFIGSQKRGTKRPELKAMVMDRCRQLGFTPRNDDEADALGILDYDLHASGETPPWRDGHLFGGALRSAAR